MPAPSKADPPDRLAPRSARSLLLTLLGEFVFPNDRPIWTATLLHTLQGVGIAEKSARQAILRSAAAGWLEASRDGRRASWSLTDQGRGLIASGSRRVRSLHGGAWDGRWLILHVPVPHADRKLRLKLGRAMGWLGFGAPAPHLWVNPHTDREAETSSLFAELKLGDVAFGFVGPSLALGMDDAALASRAWDLDAVLTHYRDLAAAFGRLRPASEDATLFAHVRLVNQLQQLPFIDPGLPDALLPPGWRGKHYDARLADIRRRWHGAAHRRWATLADAAPAR